MRIKHKLNYSVLSAACFGVLSLFIVTMLCPTRTERAEAVEGSKSTDSPVSAESSTLAIAISKGEINLVADPTVNDGIVKSSLDISAKTTNPTGYTLKISTPDTAMQSNNSSINATIPTLSSATTLANFPNNRWGYYVGASEGTNNSQFEAFNTNNMIIDTTTAASSAIRSRKLTIAAKVDTNLPASTYSAQVIVSVIANLPKATGFAGIVTMQEMTSSICSSVDIGTEGQLLDTRDETAYYVGRMKDGKCWMLQNLALGSMTSTTTLNPSDSNVSSDWTLPQAFTSATSGDKSDYNVKQLWNFGKWVLATPLLTTSCGDSGISSIANCVKVGFVDVSDSTKFEPTFTAKTMAWNGANSNSNTLVAVNCTSWSGNGASKTCTAGAYDAHYLIGNYYSWGVATATSGDGITSDDANSSICPKGWKLPTSNTIRVGSFAGLLREYGVNSNLSGTVDGKTYNIAREPLRFVRSGLINPGSHVHSAAGSDGIYWSSAAYPSSSNFAYSLHFHNSSVNPSDAFYRYYGFSVRCINDSSI